MPEPSTVQDKPYHTSEKKGRIQSLSEIERLNTGVVVEVVAVVIVVVVVSSSTISGRRDNDC